MYKLFKWIYNLGVKHERRRIKLLIAEHRQKKPELRDYTFGDDKANRDKFERDLVVWHSTTYELDKLISPESYAYIDEEEK
jgi:hypothetical protein